MLRRMAYSCTLYAFIEADTSRRHRVLHMSVEEPLDFSHESKESEQPLAEPDPAKSRADRGKGLPHQLVQAGYAHSRDRDGLGHDQSTVPRSGGGERD